MGARLLKGGNIWTAWHRFHNSNDSEEVTPFSRRSRKDKRINVDNRKCRGIKTTGELVQLGILKAGFWVFYAAVVESSNVGPGKQKELRM